MKPSMIVLGLALPADRARGVATLTHAAVSTLPIIVADLSHWGSLHDAWQDATHSRDAAPGKEPLPVGVVIAIAEHRVRAIGVLRDALERDPGLRRRIGGLQPHARDAQGRNWNMPTEACGTPPRANYEADFRRVVDALRDEFDLA